MSVLQSLESLVLEAIGNLGFWWLCEICEICWTHYLKLCLCLMQACTIISVYIFMTENLEKHRSTLNKTMTKGKRFENGTTALLAIKFPQQLSPISLLHFTPGQGTVFSISKNEIVIMNNVIPIYLYTALSMQAWIYNNKCWSCVKRFQGLQSSKKLIPYSKFIYFFKKSAFPTTSKHVKAADKFTHTAFE